MSEHPECGDCGTTDEAAETDAEPMRAEGFFSEEDFEDLKKKTKEQLVEMVTMHMRRREVMAIRAEAYEAEARAVKESVSKLETENAELKAQLEQARAQIIAQANSRRRLHTIAQNMLVTVSKLDD